MLQSHTSRSVAAICTLLIAIITLAGCGGDSAMDVQSLAELEQPAHDHDYGGAAYQNPNYYPYETGSHITYSANDTIHIGGPYQPKEQLQHFSRVTNRGRTFTTYIGPSRDGVGLDRLVNYEDDLITNDGKVIRLLSLDGFFAFRQQPSVLVESDFDFRSVHGLALYGVIRILNDILPPEFQLQLYLKPTGYYNPLGTILVQAMSPASIQAQCGASAAACASASINRLGGYTSHATLRIPNDFERTEVNSALTIIMHEMMHALGIWGHVDHMEFPDSVMGSSGHFFPNWSFILRPIDREALQVMYMSQVPSRYNSWDEWSDTGLHLMGEIDDLVRFGTVLFNGLPQPWATGQAPASNLADNTILTGIVSWEGPLLGFSGVSAIAGEVRLDVVLSQLDSPQDFKVKDLYFLNREATSPDRWFPTRNINYKVDITDNVITHESSAGHIAGHFLGKNHEGMGGTIKRTDLVGAFGGTR